MLAGLSALNLCVYVQIAKRFMYKRVEENEAPEEKELKAIIEHVDKEIIWEYHMAI